MSDIGKAIRELAGVRNQDDVKLYQCNVNSIDVAKRTCNVTTITGNAILTFDAQITAGISDGFLIIPEIDSMVFVLSSKYSLPFIISYSDITDYIIMGGEFGGLVKVIELTQKLNNLENKINEIISTFGTHTHNVTNVGQQTAPTLTPINGSLTITERVEIENTKIKHGE